MAASSNSPTASCRHPRPATPGESSNRDGELSLVEETELEESLAVTSMISKAENRYARLLYSVNQRLAVISGGSKVVDANNPLGPACLCDCFRRAMQELEADVNVKLIIYKLFERYVLAGSGDTVQRRQHRTDPGGSPAAAAPPGQPRQEIRPARRAHAPSGDEYAAADDQYVYSEEEEAMREQLYATVNQMLSQRSHVSRPGYAGRAVLPAGRPLDMQRTGLGAGAAAAAGAPGAGGPVGLDSGTCRLADAAKS